VTNFEPCAAETMRRLIRATAGSSLEVCGGVAGYVGPDSPLSAVKGLDGEPTRAELLRMIDFFSDHQRDTVLELAPWVEVACRAELASLGFERVAEELVLYRRTEDLPGAVEVVVDVEAWARVLSLSFMGEVNEMGLQMGRLVSVLEGATPVGIWREQELVAAAQMSDLAGVGLLAGDGTLEAWRGQGLQQQLICGRVQMAWAKGMEWVHCEVVPGSGSHRNYERCGFGVAYARVHFLRRFLKD
jgi:GNAT superfamily N-acetyltransferase